ncbi:hypothetical protein [Pseudoalteromonas undina]|uniref:hypothetical protein n=1 Tax=Pseudoalteromonas undina TaxID=43660 RepID=UPI0018685489|nr:hypothetical protein [Pseudoalteromonas undina]
MSYSSGTPKKEEALGDGLSSMHHTTKRLLNFKKEEFDDIAKFQSALDQALSDPTDRTYKMAVSRAYNTLHKHHLESPRVHRRPVCLSQATLPDSFKLS